MCASSAKWQPFLAKAKHQDRDNDGINIYKAHITVNLSLSYPTHIGHPQQIPSFRCVFVNEMFAFRI